jgi:histidinol dehydrogenase
MWGPLDLDKWNAGRVTSLVEVMDSVQAIIDDVWKNGDEALIRLAKQYDKVDIKSLRVSDAELDRAAAGIDPAVRKALAFAKRRIERFHRLQIKRAAWSKTVEPGITLGVKVTPLRRIGAYIPGGRASYPSTALMCVIPAKVAGVREVVCFTPPPANPLTLAALRIAGADEVYLSGGAQAIAAMAFGMKSICKVQKVVGPGNVYVTAAKIALKGAVDIDFPAGPSEIVILADSSAVPEYVAADILAQAEHDPRSPTALVTTDKSLPAKVAKELERQTTFSSRSQIIGKSLENSGYVVCTSQQLAVDIVNQLAPEHLSIQCRNASRVLNRIENAGSVFLGPYSAVACGDYASGTNHVLPTAGYAMTCSGLDVWHFCKRTSYQRIEKKGLKALSGTIEMLAEVEGLDAHARSVSIRLRESR